jgi:hypothetical protein
MEHISYFMIIIITIILIDAVGSRPMLISSVISI